MNSRGRNRVCDTKWLGRKDSNPRMPESKSGALTNLATPQRRNLRARTVRLVRRGIRISLHANAASGCRASVRATNPPHGRRPRVDRGACFGFGGERREHATRPNPSSAHEANARPNSGAQHRNVRKPRDRNRLKVIAPITLGKDFHFRRRGVSCQFRRRENRRSRHRNRRHDHGDPQRRQRDRRSGARRCRARARARLEERNGTSAPNATPIRISSARGRFASHRRLSASSTVAASELPPPMPPPSGTRLASAMSTPERARRLLLERDRRANGEIVRGARRRPTRSCARSRRRRDASA